MKFTVRKFEGDESCSASVYVFACRMVFKVGSARNPKGRLKSLRKRFLPLKLIYSVEMEAWRAREVEMFALRWLHNSKIVRDIVKPTYKIPGVDSWIGHELRGIVPSPSRNQVTEWFDGSEYAAAMVVRASEILLRRH